jgi:hypothetical protein
MYFNCVLCNLRFGKTDERSIPEAFEGAICGLFFAPFQHVTKAFLMAFVCLGVAFGLI